MVCPKKSTILTLITVACSYAVIFLISIASAQAVELSNALSFNNTWVRLLPPTSMHTAAYTNITNNGNSADLLIDVSSSAADSVSLHHTTNNKGMLQMQSADSVEIPAHSIVKFAPGGLHIMLMGLHQPLTENAEITITFNFQHAGKIDVLFQALKANK